MAVEQHKTKYCPGCGKQVEFFTMTSSAGESHRCQICSTELRDDIEIKARPAEAPTINNVIVVEDTALLREILSDIIRGRGLAKNVISCTNGAQFITTFTGMLLRRQEVGLLVLDVNMPIMNGVNAAIAIRAVEKAFRTNPTPLLFFTVKQCDDQFRNVLKYCSPAMYINKGEGSSPKEMQTRVENVVGQLIMERKRDQSEPVHETEDLW